MSVIEFKKIDLKNGETIAYRHKGKGNRVIILLHGLQSSSEFFDSLIESIDDDINIYAPDFIGYGDSSYNQKHRIIKDWAYDIYYFIKAMNFEKVYMVGWSFGGLVAMDFAGLYPEMLNKLILVSSVGNQGLNIRNILKKDRKEFKFNLSDSFRNFKINDDKSFIFWTLDRIRNNDIDFFKNLLNQSIFNVSDPDPDDLRKMAEDFIKQKCFKESILAMIKYDNTKFGSRLIENITMPVVWIHGYKDMVIPIEDAQNSLKYFPTQVDFKKFYNAGHAVFVDEKDKFIKLLEALVKD